MALPPVQRLEQYTEKHPREVLLVSVELEDGADQIAIFRGFSSSLMRPTAADPDTPVLPPTAVITQIDRLHSPYNPQTPDYLEQGLSWEEMESRLQALGL